MTRVLTGSMISTLQSAAPAAPMLPSISTCAPQGDMSVVGFEAPEVPTEQAKSPTHPPEAWF